jgi:hypothetical protein
LGGGRQFPNHFTSNFAVVPEINKYYTKQCKTSHPSLSPASSSVDNSLGSLTWHTLNHFQRHLAVIGRDSGVWRRLGMDVSQYFWGEETGPGVKAYTKVKVV